MSDREPDDVFRARLLRVVDLVDRPKVMVGVGPQLDRFGVRYDRFRTGVPLRGFDQQR
jgi:hypothetical protein